MNICTWVPNQNDHIQKYKKIAEKLKHQPTIIELDWGVIGPQEQKDSKPKELIKENRFIFRIREWFSNR
jgi:hypothetical protein